jgi:hypothetical protein
MPTNFFNDLKKIFGSKIAKVVYMFLLLVSVFCAGRSSTSTSISIVNNNDKSFSNPTAQPVTLACSIKYTDDIKTDWDFKSFSFDKQKGVCANFWSGYQYPDLTYKIPVKQDFELFEISYKITHNDKYDNPFVISVGNDPKLIKYFIQEKNPQLIGVEMFKLGDKEPDRPLPDVLKDAPKEGTVIVTSLRSSIKKGNELTFVLNVKYISNATNEPKEDSFSHDVALPEPQPGSKTTINISVPRSSCFIPISYKVCD